MTNLALVLGAVSFVGVIFLAFGYAASLKLIRELQDRPIEAGSQDAPRQFDFFRRDRFSFVLVTEEGCLACADRLADLVEWVADGSERSQLACAVLTSGAGARPITLPDEVNFVDDAEMVARLAVEILPLGLVFDRSGTEVARSVLGDRQSLERLATWARDQDARSAAEPQSAGRA